MSKPHDDPHDFDDLEFPGELNFDESEVVSEGPPAAASPDAALSDIPAQPEEPPSETAEAVPADDLAFEELAMPDDLGSAAELPTLDGLETLAGEGIAEPTFADEGAAMPVEAVEEAPEAAEAAAPSKKRRKRKVNWLFHLEWIGMLAACVSIYLIANYCNPEHPVWHATYFILMLLLVYATYKTRRIWTKFEVSAPYTAFLAIGVAALMTGVYLLALELTTYDWDYKGKNAQPYKTTYHAPEPKKCWADLGQDPPSTGQPGDPVPGRPPAAAPGGGPARPAAPAAPGATPAARTPVPGDAIPGVMDAPAVVRPVKPPAAGPVAPAKPAGKK